MINNCYAADWDVRGNIQAIISGELLSWTLMQVNIIITVWDFQPIKFPLPGKKTMAFNTTILHSFAFCAAILDLDGRGQAKCEGEYAL